jgi:hypothetical protein
MGDEFGRLNPVERYLHICEILATINERMNHHQETERQGLDTPGPRNATMPPESGGVS